MAHLQAHCSCNSLSSRHSLAATQLPVSLDSQPYVTIVLPLISATACKLLWCFSGSAASSSHSPAAAFVGGEPCPCECLEPFSQSCRLQSARTSSWPIDNVSLLSDPFPEERQKAYPLFQAGCHELSRPERWQATGGVHPLSRALRACSK